MAFGYFYRVKDKKGGVVFVSRTFPSPSVADENAKVLMRLQGYDGKYEVLSA